MANLLYQQIEMLSREKHIEPEIVVSAIEDAMVVAARKYYKTEENLRGKFNAESGQVDVFSVLTVVEEVADPKMEISLADAKKKNPCQLRHIFHRAGAIRASHHVADAFDRGIERLLPVPFVVFIVRFSHFFVASRRVTG